MARMIPPVCESSNSPGEPLVFAALREQSPTDWVILYSLDIAPWNGHRQTEIDFLVIIPDQGLLCIEVKGHQRIEYIEGIWHMGSKRERKGPFTQADDARFTLSRRLEAVDRVLGQIPVQRCVIFPIAYFELPGNISVNSWEYLDSPAFDGCVRKHTLAQFLRKCIERSNQHQNRTLRERLPEGQIERLLEFLRPTVRNEPSFKKQEKLRQLDLEVKLRVQQKPVLSLMQDNDRIIVDGAAGTGKTLIAMELARRLTATQKRVGLFCHQAAVGRWIGSKIGVIPGLVKGQFAERLQEMLRLKPPEETSGYRHWTEAELPRAALEKLQGEERAQDYLFDAIVIDEAQDILSRPGWWDLLGSLLQGGMKDGCWALLGDFKHQMLLDRAGHETLVTNLAWLRKECRPATWRLRENCRNTVIIRNSARSLARLECGELLYDGFLREAGDPNDFRHRIYQDDRDQAKLLVGEIEYWRNQGYDWDHITVLSGREDGGVAATIKAAPASGTLAEVQRKLHPLDEHEHGLCFGHVDEFKGMENRVIILTDVDLASEDDNPELRKNLFYTGLTRSLQGVSVLWTPRTSKWIQDRPS